MAQPVKLIALLKAKPGMSRAEFEKRWNVAMEEHQEIKGELPYDGTAELWWDSLEDMEEDFASPEAKRAVADADQFTTVRIHICTREHVIK